MICVGYAGKSKREAIQTLGRINRVGNKKKHLRGGLYYLMTTQTVEASEMQQKVNCFIKDGIKVTLTDCSRENKYRASSSLVKKVVEKLQQKEKE